MPLRAHTPCGRSVPAPRRADFTTETQRTHRRARRGPGVGFSATGLRFRGNVLAPVVRRTGRAELAGQPARLPFIRVHPRLQTPGRARGPAPTDFPDAGPMHRRGRPPCLPHFPLRDFSAVCAGHDCCGRDVPAPRAGFPAPPCTGLACRVAKTTFLTRANIAPPPDHHLTLCASAPHADRTHFSHLPAPSFRTPSRPLPYRCRGRTPRVGFRRRPSLCGAERGSALVPGTLPRRLFLRARGPLSSHSDSVTP